MSTIKSNARIEVKIVLELTELEARALEAIVGYGSKPFKEWFYRNLGKHYLEPHHKGVDSLFETVKKELPYHLDKATEARKLFNK